MRMERRKETIKNRKKREENPFNMHPQGNAKKKIKWRVTKKGARTTLRKKEPST
jgi:hypothetical protein